MVQKSKLVALRINNINKCINCHIFTHHSSFINIIVCWKDFKLNNYINNLLH